MGFSLKWSLYFFALSLTHVGVLAQDATGTATAAAATFTVEVGKGEHKFKPDVIQAEVGDLIQFNFFPPNHSVVRAAYLSPCIPYEKIVPGEKGFFSGFHPVDAILSNPPNWTLRLNDTDPIFFYCSAPGSCITYQMVGVINPNSTTLLSVQKEYAANSSYMLQPGDDFPSEGGPTSTLSTSSSASPTSTSTSASVAAATSSPPATTIDHKSSFPAGAIAGIVVGVLVIIALAAALFYFVGRHRTVKAQQVVTSILGSDRGTGGQGSPVVPPAEPIVGPGGMVYVPVQASSDFRRISTPPVYGNPDPSQPRQSTTAMQETYHTAPSAPLSSSPVELYAPKQ